MRLLFLILLFPFLANAQTVPINGTGTTVTINAPGNPSTVNITVVADTVDSLTIPMLVFSGESNSGGQALNSAATAEELAIRPETKILNNNTLLFESLDIGTNNLIGHQNMGTPELRHSWELGISNLAASATISNPTYIVKTGHGGTTIAQFAEGGIYQSMRPWDTLIRRVNAALSILNPTGIKFALLYSQGINDALAFTDTTTWKAATIAHFQNIRAEYGEVPIVMTKIMTSAPSYANYNSAIESICSALTRCYFIDVTGAATQDNYHWSYAGQKLIAERMIDKLIENGFDL